MSANKTNKEQKLQNIIFALFKLSDLLERKLEVEKVKMEIHNKKQMKIDC
jgi:hypothetical protein